MISSNIAEVQDELRDIQNDLDYTIDQTIRVELTAFIERMQGITPVVTGRMKANYGIDENGIGLFDVYDEQFYTDMVIYGTERSRDNPALRRMIEDEEEEMVALIDAAIVHVSGTWV